MTPAPHVDPMVSFLAGWLTGQLMREGKECMKIAEIRPHAGDVGYDGCIVQFASGLRLKITVEEIT